EEGAEGGRVAAIPIMLAHCGEEVIARGPCPVRAGVGIDVVVVVLTRFGVVRCGGDSGGVIVVARRDEQVRVPAVDQTRHGLFVWPCGAVVPDDREVGAGGGQTVFQQLHPQGVGCSASCVL